MFPVICTIGPFSVYSYGLMLAVAVIVCSLFLNRDTRAFNIPPGIISDFIFWVVLGGIMGARAGFILLNLDFYINNPGEMIMIQNGGLAWQGGFFAGIVVAAGYIRKKHLPFLITIDLIAPYLALGQAIGRVGCFLNGCCYGRPVSAGIYFPVHDARLHPTQLYATLGLVIVFFILKRFQRISKTHGREAGRPAGRIGTGQVFGLYLILSSTQRFINEFFRGDHTATLWGLSIFQIVALVIFTGGFFIFWKTGTGSRST